MIRGRDKEACGVLMLKELEERVEDPPDLANLVRPSAFTAEGINFIEEVDAPCCGERFEDQPQFRCGLAHELRDDTVKPDKEERQVQFARERPGRHSLACTGWADQQQPL